MEDDEDDDVYYDFRHMPTVECPMCRQHVTHIELIPHIPQCYQQFCKKVKMLPLCTCDGCEGKRAHIKSLSLPMPSI